jgi:perosamine synthetase
MIPVSMPNITQEDIMSVSSALAKGYVSGGTPIVNEFEENWASICNRKFGVAVSNGTVALDLALEVLNLKPGDEIILPSFTIISCLNAVLRLKLVPVFIDANADDWNMSCEEIENRITSKTKAIIAVHIYGLPTDMDRILELAKKYSLHVIEDAAEAHGLKYKKKICGSFGVMSTFSFYSNKNITTGEGGMILTDDPVLASKLQNLRNLNFRKDERFISDELGYNQRMSSMQAALGVSQLKRLDGVISSRKDIANNYRELLKDLDFIQLPASQNNFSENHYWVFGLVLKNEFKNRAKDIMKVLRNQGIETRAFFQGLHRQPVLEKYSYANQENLRISENLSASGFYIPNGLNIKMEQQIIVAEKIANLKSLKI